MVNPSDSFSDKASQAVGSTTKGDEFKQNTKMGSDIMSLYPIDGKCWYQTFPYVFSINNLDKPSDVFRYAMTIPPESLVTQLIAPTEAVPTLGGVVEEPSQVMFWSIQMAGTTGIAPSRSTGDNYSTEEDGLGSEVDKPATNFRTALTKTGLLSGLIGNLLGPVDKVMAVAGAFSEDGIKDGLQAMLQPNLPYSRSSVNDVSNGYTEIHRLHKFFIFYSMLNSRQDTNEISKKYSKNQYGLFFYNYKDNQKFRIVLKNFMMIKTHNAPFLYRYQIQFKGWQLQPATTGTQGDLAQNRFKGDLATVNTLTVTSAISSAKNLVRGFKSVQSDPIGCFLSVPPVV